MIDRVIGSAVDSVFTDNPAAMGEVLRERETLTPAEKMVLRMRRLLVK